MASCVAGSVVGDVAWAGRPQDGQPPSPKSSRPTAKWERVRLEITEVIPALCGWHERCHVIGRIPSICPNW